MKFPEWHGMIVALGIGGAENEGRKKILRLSVSAVKPRTSGWGYKACY